MICYFFSICPHLRIISYDQSKWLEHIQYIKNNVSKSIDILYKIRNFREKTTLHNLYGWYIVKSAHRKIGTMKESVRLRRLISGKSLQ